MGEREPEKEVVMASEDPVSRAAFLRRSWRSTLEAGAALASMALPFSWLDGGGRWEQACTAEELERPRLKTLHGTYLVLARDANRVTAYRAHCPEDGGPLQREPPAGELGCPFCGRRYDPVSGQALDGDRRLEFYEAKLENGVAYIRVG